MNAKAKTSENPRAYLFAGDDDFRKQQELDKLLSKLVSPDFADFDLERMEGDSATSDRIMAGLSVPPFASDQRVVLVKYANKMPPPEQEKLASQLGKTPASGCLVLISPAPEKVDGRPRKGSEVIGDLSKAVRKIGTVIRVGDERPRDKAENARQFAQSTFADAGKKIDSAALASFMQRVGSDFAVLNTEARKLIDYTGNSDRITAQDVAKVTSETPEEKVFKLIDAVGTKNASEALRNLDELFETGDNPSADAPKTLATIARHFRLLWQTKMLVSNGATDFRKEAVPDHLRSALPSSPNILEVSGRQSWMADRLKKQASRFTRDELIRSFTLIARADLMLKGAEGDIEDPRMVMEILVIELAKSGDRR